MRMAELVALLMPAGDGFVEALQRVWAAGGAVLPLDPRSPAAHTRRLLDRLRPTAIVEPDGERRRLDDGIPVEPGDAVVIATSGTTGDPKGVVHTHDGIAAAAALTAPTRRSRPGGVRWLACLPLVHVGGFSVVTRALLDDVGLEVHERADAARIDDAARRGATHVSLVPTLLARIDPTRWETILLGGSAPPAERPPNTVATYGLTETFGGVVYDGRPLPGVGVRIHDPDVDGVGAVELRSPTLLRTYRSGFGPDGAGTGAVDGWLRTGDLGSIDADGTLHVAGRADDLIISGGVNIWPGPVEELLRADPSVADVAVVGRADPEWGQRVVAVIVPSDPGAPPALDALRDLIRSRMPVAAAPRELELVDVLPRTAVGKIARHALRPGARKVGADDAI